MQKYWDDFISWMGKFPQKNIPGGYASQRNKHVRVKGKTEDEAKELLVKETTNLIEKMDKELIYVRFMPEIKLGTLYEENKGYWLGYAVIYEDYEKEVHANA